MLGISTALSLLLLPIGVTPTIPNLDFKSGFKFWKGQGFQLSTDGSVHSQQEKDGQALLYRDFTLPRNAGTIHFRAVAHRANQQSGSRYLDVYLEAAGRKIIPKFLESSPHGDSVPSVLASTKELRKYFWSVPDYAGKTVRIVLVDYQSEAGDYLQCSGFSLQPVNVYQRQLFQQELSDLAREKKLPTLQGYSSPHFQAFSNASESFTNAQLRRSEDMYRQFQAHFQRKGFALTVPRQKMMITIFETPKGLNAYLNYPLSIAVTGLYHPPSNRLVVYNYANNKLLVKRTETTKKIARTSGDNIRQKVWATTMQRELDAIKTLANISTIMHETAHQLSFNFGMLNRRGDVPLWLAEGLACYCEATAGDTWKGIGALNPVRIKSVTTALKERTKVLSIKDLIEGDDWFRGRFGWKFAEVGYAQSWALFRMLIDEQPRELRKYLKLIYQRKTSEHRLADFAQCFGSDIKRLEKRHQKYLISLTNHSR